jgi:hypothetical protein
MAFKESDLNSLTNKLDNFGKGLPEQEKHVLDWLIARAKAETHLNDTDLESASGGTISVSAEWSR